MVSALVNAVGWIGFFVSLGVLASPCITAMGLERAGSVGKLSITFFVFVFMNCVNMAFYGLLTGNLQLTLCNMWGMASATFAVCSFLTLIKREEQQRFRERQLQQEEMGFYVQGDTSKAGRPPPPLAVAAPSSGVVLSNLASSAGGASSHAADGGYDDGASTSLADTGVTYAQSLKFAIVCIVGDLCAVAITTLVSASGATEAAHRMGGVMGAVMGTVMFGGPLDQIGWIVKNKSSAPLSPVIITAAAANSLAWGSYGLLTLDPWLIFPNTCAGILTVIQVVLFVAYPRGSEHSSQAQHNVVEDGVRKSASMEIAT